MNSKKHSPPKVIVTISVNPELAKRLTELAKENALSRSQFIEYLTCKSLVDYGYCSEEDITPYESEVLL